MPSSKEFKNFILDQLKILDDIICKSMMGEFLLYYKGILFGGIYDDRLIEDIPYKNAKPMFMVENLEDVEYLSNLIKDTCFDLEK